MDIKLGFMQGRLVEKYEGRYQAFHPDLWEDEFEIAESLNLHNIELIADFENLEKNPVFGSHKQLNHLLGVANDTGIKLDSICADYFMEFELFDRTMLTINEKSLDVLKRLLENSAFIGVTNVVMPFVDNSSIRDFWWQEWFLDGLKEIMPLFETNNVYAAFEVDLYPQAVEQLILGLKSSHARVNYDVGNSASLGFNIGTELSAYGEYVSDIHLKDRVLNGGPVKFGQGNSDFEVLFDFVKSTNFDGPLIMQSYRDDEGLTVFKEQLNWIRESFLKK